MPRPDIPPNGSEARPAAPDIVPDRVRTELAPLLALLDLVGPADTPALLTQIGADLETCGTMIEAATPAQDWLELRRASHNLTALAGTAGAEILQRLAEDLNRAAHAGDRAAVLNLGPRVRAGITALLAGIGTLAANTEAR